MPRRVHLETALVDEIWQATSGNYVLGDARISAEIEAKPRRRVTPGKAGKPGKD